MTGRPEVGPYRPAAPGKRQEFHLTTPKSQCCPAPKGDAQKAKGARGLLFEAGWGIYVTVGPRGPARTS